MEVEEKQMHCMDNKMMNNIKDLSIIIKKNYLLIISFSYTGTYPRAMMIKLENTVVTISTVRAPRWSKNIALPNIQNIV
jgi:hypothetical protein